MLSLSEEIPLVEPTAADGAFVLLWLIVALPLAGAAILLIGGALFPKPLKVWGHVLGMPAADRVVRDQPGAVPAAAWVARRATARSSSTSTTSSRSARSTWAWTCSTTR